MDPDAIVCQTMWIADDVKSHEACAGAMALEEGRSSRASDSRHCNAISRTNNVR